MQIQPMQDHVLVRPPEKMEKTEGGLFVPQTVDTAEATEVGVVVAAGKGRFTEYGTFLESPIKEGMSVLYRPRAGLPVKMNGEELLLLELRDVLTTVTE